MRLRHGTHTWCAVVVDVTLAESAEIDDGELTRLHHRAFAHPDGRVIGWSERLNTYSLTWVSARLDGDLVGFVNVIGDGGVHAVLLDTVVDPRVQGHGIGRRLVDRARKAATARGCRWLHVDYEPDLADFYERVCGFGTTRAGLMPLVPTEAGAS